MDTYVYKYAHIWINKYLIFPLVSTPINRTQFILHVNSVFLLLYEFLSQKNIFRFSVDFFSTILVYRKTEKIVEFAQIEQQFCLIIDILF